MLTGVYASIVNPGVARFGGSVVSVTGPPGNPSAVVLAGRRAFRRGAILSIAPSARLPRGVLSHVEAVSVRGNRTTLRLRPASPFEVAPAFEFDAALTARTPARAGAASCGGVSGLSPIREIRNISFSGGWNTKRIFRQDIKVGVRAMVGFDVEAGLHVTRGVGVDCSAVVSVSANGMAGPIPITAAIEGELTAYAGVGVDIKTSGSLHVDAGASTVGVPPALIWVPDVRFSDPRFTFSAETFAEARAGIGVGVKAGIGNDHIASATIKLGSSLDLSARPGACSWDARFGQFSAGGKILRWNISTPKTPALFTKNLWRAPCGGRSQPAPPGGGDGSRPQPGPSPNPLPPADESGGLLTATQISAGGYHSCAVRLSGQAVCWGSNDAGQLGNGRTSEFSTPGSLTPVDVTGLSDAKQVAAGLNHTCAVRATGKAACWGHGSGGALGNGGSSSPVPVAVTGLDDATQVDAGYHHSCAVRAAGTVVCWGDDYYGYGVLGDGRSMTSTVPVQVSGLTDVAQVDADAHITCARRTVGDVWCWGAGGGGYREDGSRIDAATPVKVPGLEDAVDLAVAGGGHCAVRATRAVVCIGTDRSLELVPGLTDAVSITSGNGHACAVRANGAAVCWGDGAQGQLGSGEYNYSFEPITVTAATGVTQVSAGGYGHSDFAYNHTCALAANSEALCWGSGNYGQLGDGSTAGRAVPGPVSP